MIRRYCFLGSL